MVMTVLPLALVMESPEQDAVRSPKVKKTRPEVLTTAPPPVHAPPACGNAVGEAAAEGATELAAVGATVVGRSEAATRARPAPGAAVTSSGVAPRIRSVVQKPWLCCCLNEAGASAAAAEGVAAVSAPVIRAPAAMRTDKAVR